MENKVVMSVSEIGMNEAIPKALEFLTAIEKEVKTPVNTIVIVETMRAIMELGGVKIDEDSYEVIKENITELLKKKHRGD